MPAQTPPEFIAQTADLGLCASEFGSLRHTVCSLLNLIADTWPHRDVIIRNHALGIARALRAELDAEV